MSHPQVRVLIVDDSPVALAVLSAVFKAGHFDVATAAHGQEGFDLALRALPDVIVTDCVMPGVDGFGLLRLLKAHPATSAIPVVMLTSSEFTAPQPGSDQPQPEVFISKVTPMEELLGVVRRVLTASQGGR
jgi:CheY-like chemotaxis protein